MSTSKKRILVTGSNGQLGKELQVIANQTDQFVWHFTDRQSFDIATPSAVSALFQQQPVDYCINCAAYTSVDKAESEKELAWAINVEGTKYLAEQCARKDIPFFHFSTDYVYDSQHNLPFKEDDPINPSGYYALTKLEGEKEARKVFPNTLIFRTSWVYSTFGHNFVKTMLRLGKERSELKVVFDQIGTPTYGRHLAKAIMHIIGQLASGKKSLVDIAGIYNYSNEGVCSWYDFALAIFELKQIPCTVYPIETKEFPTPAQRPPFSVLNKTKFKNAFSQEIFHWRVALKECLDLID